MKSKALASGSRIYFVQGSCCPSVPTLGALGLSSHQIHSASIPSIPAQPEGTCRDTAIPKEPPVRHPPAANLFLMREKRYPAPTSSMSQLDRVLPSLVNCTASGAGLLGPSDSWNRASSDPTPAIGTPKETLMSTEGHSEHPSAGTDNGMPKVLRAETPGRGRGKPPSSSQQDSAFHTPQRWERLSTWKTSCGSQQSSQQGCEGGLSLLIEGSKGLGKPPHPNPVCECPS